MFRQTILVLLILYHIAFIITINSVPSSACGDKDYNFSANSIYADIESSRILDELRNASKEKLSFKCDLPKNIKAYSHFEKNRIIALNTIKLFIEYKNNINSEECFDCTRNELLEGLKMEYFAVVLCKSRIRITIVMNNIEQVVLYSIYYKNINTTLNNNERNRLISNLTKIISEEYGKPIKEHYCERDGMDNYCSHGKRFIHDVWEMGNKSAILTADELIIQIGEDGFVEQLEVLENKQQQ